MDSIVRFFDYHSKKFCFNTGMIVGGVFVFLFDVLLLVLTGIL